MSERPSQPNIPVVLCPKCGTSNPRDVAECIYCGAALLPADTSAAADLGPGRSCSIGCAAAVVAGVVSIAFYAAFLAISAAASLALASYAVHAFISTRKKESQVGPAAGRSASGRPTVDALTTVVTVLGGCPPTYPDPVSEWDAAGGFVTAHTGRLRAARAYCAVMTIVCVTGTNAPTMASASV